MTDYTSEMIRVILNKICSFTDVNESGQKKINECIELGNKIISENYGEEADNYFEEYGSFEWLLDNDDGTNEYTKWVELTLTAIKLRDKDIKKFWNKISKADNWGE